jgi:uncharacterized membrane protein
LIWSYTSARVLPLGNLDDGGELGSSGKMTGPWYLRPPGEICPFVSGGLKSHFCLSSHQLCGTLENWLRFLWMRNGLTRERPRRGGMSPALERNIRALVGRRRREEAAATTQQKFADQITAFTGSMVFVYLHLAIFGFWIVANLNWIPRVPAWDSSFVILGMVASVEAIFLSTFVLISQNRMGAEADKRADLDLQISLLTEHELTKVASVLDEIAKKLSIEPEAEGELKEASRDIAPERVLDKIDESNR